VFSVSETAADACRGAATCLECGDLSPSNRGMARLGASSGAGRQGGQQVKRRRVAALHRPALKTYEAEKAFEVAFIVRSQTYFGHCRMQSCSRRMSRKSPGSVASSI